MKNLQSFNVQELSTQEQKQIDGGWFFTALLVAVVVLGVVALGNAIGNSFDDCEES
ncbi:hypothetical protein [uncultured Polaribacter sp.]|uniref:hypothetical protein n=1 Tax=uncultured Polaribacter sp. TaxID=174711 RepID=UPI0030DD5D9B|tara:strand:+ start:33 stop:200 length:168 start_codon:yes stop_codon:yes gene_type:complete